MELAVIDTDGTQTKFTFEELTLATLHEGMYHVEKFRAVVEEIKVGKSLVNQFEKVFGDMEDPFFTTCKVTLLRNGNVFFMGPDEILFKSNISDIFARAKQVEKNND